MSLPTLNRDYQIQAGPSKWDFILSLFHGSGNRDNRHLVRFQVKGLRAFEVLIDSVTREDSSGESWIFAGWTSAFRPHGQVELIELYQVRGSFSTQDRAGTLKFMEY